MDRDGGAVGGRRLECVLTWVVAARREFEAGGSWEGVCKCVEGEGAGEGECGDDVGRSDESVSGIVAACKVAVLQSDN